MGAQGHVLQRGEIPRERLGVAAVLLVGKVGFHHLVQVDGVFQGVFIAAHLVEFGQAVDGETLGIELFLAVQALPFRGDAPIDAAVFVVAEVVQEPVAGMHGRHQVFGLLQLAVRGGEAPDEAGVQDDAAGGVVEDGAVGGDLSVEAAARVFQFKPVREDVGGQVFPDLLEKQLGIGIHIN